MSLPVTLQHHDDEAPISLVARLAAANGYPSLRAFLAHTDTTANAIVLGEAEALSLVRTWSGVAVERLGQLVATGSGPGGTWRIGHATFNKDMRPGRLHRFCARCVLEDREREKGRLSSRAYHRAWWSVRGIEGCPVHGCKLTEVEVPADGDVHDFPQFVNSNLALIREVGAAPAPSRQPELDRYLCERVFRVEGDGFLDRLDAHVAAEFSRYLGEFLNRHDVEGWMDRDTDLREWGFKLAVQGEDEIRRALTTAIDRERPKVRNVEPFLGPMVLWLRRNGGKEAYQPVIDLIQDIVERTMPFGEGQVFLKPVQARHVYCVNSAHADYGITKQRIRVLMEANEPAFRKGLSDASTYFNAAALRSILEAACATLTSKEAAVIIGVSDERLHDILNAGLIRQVEKRTDEDRVYTRIAKTDLDEFQRTLNEKMTTIASDTGMITLASAARAWSRPIHDLLAMILDGRLVAFVISGTTPILERTCLAHDALQIEQGRFAGGNDELIRIKEVEKVLGTTTATVTELIKRGYLTVRTMRRPETGRDIKLVERAGLADFQSRYVSLSTIAKAHTGYRAAIKTELDHSGVHPIFEPEGFIARFYRKSELIRAGFAAS